MMNSQTSEALALYQTVLEHLKANDFRDKERLIAYYNKYYEIVKVHKPILNEEWNEHGVTRHGWTDIKGTVSEMLTAYYCAKVHKWRVFPISDQNDQNWGSDLLIEQGCKREKISVKSVKAWAHNGDTRLNLDEDFFTPGLFRIAFISLVDPVKNQLWMFNYEALATEYCTISNQRCTPKFKEYTYMYINQFVDKYPGTFNYQNLDLI